MWHGPMQGSWMSGWGWVMGLLVLLFVVLILAGIVFLIWFLVAVARRTSAEAPATPQETPLDILKKRYAQGEITPEQYQQMKRDLEA